MRHSGLHFFFVAVVLFFFFFTRINKQRLAIKAKLEGILEAPESGYRSKVIKHLKIPRGQMKIHQTPASTLNSTAFLYSRKFYAAIIDAWRSLHLSLIHI